MQPDQIQTGRYYYARRKSDGQIDVLWCYQHSPRPKLSSARSHVVADEQYELLGPVPEWQARQMA